METRLGLKLESPAFKNGGRIPDKYTCNGKNISPELRWSQVGAGVKSWALIIDDPDAPAGIFTHWVIFNIPAETTSLPENVPASETTSFGALQGNNQTRKIGYTGPCPSPGPVHHYNFSLYALDSLLNLPSGATKEQVQKAVRGHILAQAKLIGLYQAS